MIAGQKVWLIFDPNGGGIEVGDALGFSSIGFEVHTLTEPVGPADLQTFKPGDIRVIPEPASVTMIGLATGCAWFIRRFFA